MTRTDQVAAIVAGRPAARTGLDLTPAVSSVYSFTEYEKALAAAAAPSSPGKNMLRP